MKDRVPYIDAVQGLSEPIFIVTSHGALLNANSAGLSMVGLAAVASTLLRVCAEHSLAIPAENPL